MEGEMLEEGGKIRGRGGAVLVAEGKGGRGQERGRRGGALLVARGGGARCNAIRWEGRIRERGGSSGGVM